MSEPSLVVRIAANLQELRQNLAEGRAQIETTTAAVQRMSNSLDGTKIARDANAMVQALGGVSGVAQLTEREQARVNRTVTEAIAKYQALGRTAPAELHQIAEATSRAAQPTSLLATTVGRLASGFAIGALVDRGISALAGFAAQAFETAGTVADMSDRLGVSTTAVQQWAYVAGQTGTTVEAFSTAVFRLGTNLAGDSKSVEAAVQALGLSFADLRAQTPEAQFDAIAEALGRMENPQERNRIGLELFGKQFQAIAPSIVQGYRDMAASASVSSDQTIQALDAAGDALDRMKNRISTGVTWSLGQLAIGLEQAGTALKAAFGVNIKAAAEEAERAAAKKREAAQAVQRLAVEVDQAAPKVEKLTTATKGAGEAARETGIVWGELGNIVRFQIAGVISPDLISFATNTDNATKAMDELTEAIYRTQGAAIAIGPPLENLATLPWVEFRQSVAQTGTETEGWFGRIFGGAQGLGSSLSSIFSAAFTGGGGAVGAVKAFATETLSTLLSMIPGIGGWIAMISGPVIEMFSRWIGKAREFFRELFGGPSRGELNDRNLVKDWEDQMIASSTAAQNETERWRQVVVATTEAYLRNGRTAEEALADVKRLWDSSREGGEETWRVIDDINRKMLAQGAAVADSVDRVGAALNNLPDEVDISIRGNYTGPDPANRSGYASGTMGVHGSWFRDFGPATATVLHGREAVVTPQQAPAFARAVLGGGDDELKRLLRGLPRALKLAMREAAVMA